MAFRDTNETTVRKAKADKTALAKKHFLIRQRDQDTVIVGGTGGNKVECEG